LDARREWQWSSGDEEEEDDDKEIVEERRFGGTYPFPNDTCMALIALNRES
jgi:hypothetical protein